MKTAAHYNQALDLMRSGFSAQAAAQMVGGCLGSVAAVAVERPARSSYVPGPRFAQPRVKPVFRVETPRLTVMRVIEEVADRYGLTAGDLLGPRHLRHHAYARHVAMYEVRERFGLSLPAIGALFGGRDHTSVMEGLRNHQARVAWGEALIAMGGGL